MPTIRNIGKSAITDYRVNALYALSGDYSPEAEELLIVATSDSCPQVRKAGLAVLLERFDEKYLPLLYAALHDDDNEVRKFADEQMIIYEENSSRLCYINTSIKEPDCSEQVVIKELLSVPDYIKALSDRNLRVRYSAVKALIGVIDPQIIPPIITLIENSKEDVGFRSCLLNVLAQFDPNMLLDELFLFLQDKDLGVWASNMLANINDQMVHTRLLDALCSDNRIVKINAATALQNSVDVRALLPLCYMLEDSEDYFRITAINSISNFWTDSIGDQTHQDNILLSNGIKKCVVEALIKASRDKNDNVRGKALRLLSVLDKYQALPVLLFALDEFIHIVTDCDYQEDKGEWLYGFNLFQHHLFCSILNLGDKIFCEPLTQLFNSNCWNVKFDVVETLFNLGDDRGLKLLIAALEQNDWVVKVRAATMLFKRGDKCGWDILVEALSVEDVDDDRWWYFQANIVDLLVKSGDSRMVDILINVLDSMSAKSDNMVAEDMMIHNDLVFTIITSLGELGDARTIESIKKWQNYDIVGIAWSETREDTVKKALRLLSQ